MKFRKPSPAMAVAFAALLVALGGTSYAAFGPFKGDKIVKKHSLSGNRLKDHAITGAQLRLSQIGKVPNASNADIAAFATRATTADKANSVPPLQFTPLTLINGWAHFTASGDYGTPAYAKDLQGLVHLHGGLDGSGQSDTVFATLPVGFRPSTLIWLRASASDGSGHPRLVDISVSPDGSVKVQNPMGVTADPFVGLDGLSFPVGAP